MYEVAARENTDIGCGFVQISWVKGATLWDYDLRVYDRWAYFLAHVWPIKTSISHVCCSPRIISRVVKPVSNMEINGFFAFLFLMLNIYMTCFERLYMHSLISLQGLVRLCMMFQRVKLYRCCPSMALYETFCRRQWEEPSSLIILNGSTRGVLSRWKRYELRVDMNARTLYLLLIRLTFK